MKENEVSDKHRASCDGDGAQQGGRIMQATDTLPMLVKRRDELGDHESRPAMDSGNRLGLLCPRNRYARPWAVVGRQM